MTLRLAVVLMVLTACGRPAVSPAGASVRATIVHSGEHVIVRVIPAFGTRINALLPPLLELSTGHTEHLGSAAVTADSAYYVAPPEVVLPAETKFTGAIIRASICDGRAAVCRVVVIPL